MCGFADAAVVERRRLTAAVLAAMLLIPGPRWPGAGWNVAVADSEGRRTIEVYVREQWYRARPEPERRWRGELHKRAVVQGPGSRTSLGFTLVTEEGDFAVYSAGMAQRLAPLMGRPIEAFGKLVDLRSEGLGQELWIGTVRSLDEQSE
jgi:hypothetical protein